MERDDRANDPDRVTDEWVEPEESTTIRRPRERDEVSVERTEVVSDAAPPGPPPGAPVPPGGPEVEEAVVRQSETIRQREDGTIERDVVRHEERRRSTGERVGIALAVLLLLLAAAGAAYWYFTQEQTTEVPSVQGLPVDQAVSRLQDEELRADIVTEPNDADEGTVFSQNPGAGSEVDEGSSVEIRVSGGPDTTAVPNAVGLGEAEARGNLVSAGFQVETKEVFSDREPGSVTAQQPTAGSQLAAGETVTISVSKGTGLVEVPNVVGLSRGEAEAELSSAKLEANVVEVPSDQPEGSVVAQNPVGGQLREGSSVRLNVSAGR